MIGRIGNETELDSPEIFRQYRVVEPEKVAGFLDANPFLNPLILEASPEISKVFQEPELFLQLVTDKEDPADSRLVISIDPTEVPKDAFDKLKLLRQDWWFDVSESGQDKLEIILRYR